MSSAAQTSVLVGTADLNLLAVYHSHSSQLPETQNFENPEAVDNLLPKT